MMTVGSLFAGIGGFDLGLERAGFTVKWQVENDPYCERVLGARWPHVPRYQDVRTVALTCAPRKQQLERIDLLVGGFPCQDLSVAGQRRGLKGERSSLFGEIIRIAHAIQPTWGLVENVPGLFSSDGGRDLATVLEGLRECWPVVGYRVLDSQYFGVAQRRRRLFLVGGPSVAGVEQILFESEGRDGNLTASGGTGTDLAASLRSRSHRAGVNAPGRGGEDDVNVVVSHALKSQRGYRQDPSHESYVIAPAVEACLNPGHDLMNLIAHALSAAGADASEDGTGRGVPMVWPDPRRHDDRHRGMIRQKPSLNATCNDLVGVRRLTPTECERLQGFPDGWTCLCSQAPCRCPDGPRYRALGNAVTVPVIEWLGRRILISSSPQPPVVSPVEP